MLYSADHKGSTEKLDILLGSFAKVELDSAVGSMNLYQ